MHDLGGIRLFYFHGHKLVSTLCHKHSLKGTYQFSTSKLDVFKCWKIMQQNCATQDEKFAHSNIYFLFDKFMRYKNRSVGPVLI